MGNQGEPLLKLFKYDDICLLANAFSWFILLERRDEAIIEFQENHKHKLP
jgi:hypothetical protein